MKQLNGCSTLPRDLVRPPANQWFEQLAEKKKLEADNYLFLLNLKQDLAVH